MAGMIRVTVLPVWGTVFSVLVTFQEWGIVSRAPVITSQAPGTAVPVVSVMAAAVPGGMVAVVVSDTVVVSAVVMEEATEAVTAVVISIRAANHARRHIF